MNDRHRLRTAGLVVVAALAVSAVVAAPAAHATAHRKKLKATPTPTVAGALQVGRTLRAKAGAWRPAGVKLTYRWYAGKTAINGATKKTYTVPAAEAGKKLAVTVTGSKHGYRSVTKRSEPTAAVRPAALTATPTPTITGMAAVGSPLTATPGTWKPSGVKLAYRWAAGGVTIAGATKPAYVPVPVDSGRAITVTVTGSKTGYTTVAKTSAPTTDVMVVSVPMQQALQDCINDGLAEPDGTPVTAAQIEGLTLLGCGGYGITDISPLSDATSLTTLYLNDDQISDFAALESLPDLTGLDLHDDGLSNLAPLASMSQLTALDLHGNAITDISPVAGLTALTYLDLSGNQITDLSPIASVIATDPLDPRSLLLGGQAEPLGTATVGTPFALPPVTSPTGGSEALTVPGGSSAQGSVSGGSVTWTGAGTGEVTWSDASISYGSSQTATFSGTFTQPVVGGCSVHSAAGADC